MITVRPAETVLLTDQVYLALQEAILNGSLPAGARLKVRDLAEQVGTSVQPVREAIRRLEQAGMAERTPHKGAIVTDLTITQLSQVYETRLILEREVTAIGVPNLTSQDLDRMSNVLQEMRAAINDDDIITYLNKDEEFLEIIYQASKNEVMVSVIRSLWARCRAFKIIGAKRSFDMNKRAPLWENQEALLSAAKERDGKLAAALSEKSLREATHRIEATLSSKPISDEA